ncbi:hypothetical protein [Vibrio jasicida]|uniref:hypothetical protein n=1 Tax=Vibrio jasicida TaxID=766224 RepID=UPI0005F0498F|nr:hypothetical protein [Vibrio jasicida]
MNPNSPMSYYQIGAVSVTNGSDIVRGYKTEWVKTDRAGKPRKGAIFTIDQANFYVVNEVIDDVTIRLTEPFIAPNQINTSYLIITQMAIDITIDDKVDLEDIINAFESYLQLAKDWAIKTDGPVEDNEYSSKYHARLSADSSVSAQEDAALASSSAASALQSKNSAADSAAKAAASEASVEADANRASAAASSAQDDAAKAAASEVSASQDAAQVAISEANVTQSEKNVKASEKLVHDFTVGPNPPSDLDTPSDINNAYYYFQQVLNLTSGAISFNNRFTPTAAKEYPDKPATSGLWIVSTQDVNGYTFQTGSMKGVTTKSGDWFVYYKSVDQFQVLFVSPLHKSSISQATEALLGIAKVASQATVNEGRNHTDFVTSLTLASTYVRQTLTICGKPLSNDINLIASDVGAANSVHTHPWGNITGVPVYTTRWPSWGEVTSKPSSFTPSAHTHPWNNITGVPVYTTRWPTANEINGTFSTVSCASDVVAFVGTRENTLNQTMERLSNRKVEGNVTAYVAVEMLIDIIELQQGELDELRNRLEAIGA